MTKVVRSFASGLFSLVIFSYLQQSVCAYAPALMATFPTHQSTTMAEALYRSQSHRLGPNPTEHFSKPLPLPRSESLAYREPRRVHDDTVLGGVFSSRYSRHNEALQAARPRTANAVVQKPFVPGQHNLVKVYTPTSPALFYAAELHTNKPLPSPSPLSPGKAITSDDEEPHFAYWPGRTKQPATYVPNAPPTHTPSASVGYTRPKLSRWNSIKGFLGKKSSHSHSASMVTSPTKPIHSFDSLEATHSRSATQTNATMHRKAWSSEGKHRQPWRMMSGRQKSSQKVQTYVPTRGIPEEEEVVAQSFGHNQDNGSGFQGGHKFQGGTTTAPKPMLDVEIPDVKMERYSVMFGGLTRANTAPTLLVRRQSKARQANPHAPEPLRTPNLPYLDTKPCPPTPRSAARHQLSLFPSPSPRASPRSPHISQLSLNRPHALVRSHTNPSPRSTLSMQHSYQPSISSMANTISEEGPLGPHEVSDDLSLLKPPKMFGLRRKRSTESLGGSTPRSMTPRSETFSTKSDNGPILHIIDLWKRPKAVPETTLITTVLPEEDKDQQQQQKPRKRGSSESTDDSATPTAFSGETAVEESPVAQVSVARQMSLKRARSVKRDLTPGKERSPSPRLVGDRTMSPTLVEVGHRAKMKSQYIEIDGC